MDKIFTHIATRIANASGQPITFMLALGLIIVWAATGPAFHYSDTWQLIVNTSTTIVTFLMVFLIQNSQNRDASAMQAKLDELIRSVDKAREQFIGIEHLTDLEICEIRDALEKEVGDAEDKQRTADDTVDRLLKRHYRIRRREMRKANAG
jgi:low affinity Fe/Cu permease